MNYKVISDKVHRLKNGQLGVCIVANVCQDKNFKKGSPYMGRVFKRTIICNARLGIKFESKVEAKLDGRKYDVEKPNGMTWVDYPFFKQADKSGKYYLSINYRKCDKQTQFKSVYILDGHVACPTEIAEIEKTMYSKGSGYSQKQATAGITNEEEQTKVVQYNVEDIIYLGTNKADALNSFEG